MPRLKDLLARITVLMVLLILPGLAHSADKIVILVRHAEKETGQDPNLSPAGEERAKALTLVVSDMNVDHVIVSQWKRTQETAAPVLLRDELKAEVVETTGGLNTHVSAVALAIQERPDGETILVVGHSNTIPAIVTALGGPKLPDLEEKSEYSTLFTMVLSKGGAARLIRSRYGPANPADSPVKNQP